MFREKNNFRKGVGLGCIFFLLVSFDFNTDKFLVVWVWGGLTDFETTILGPEYPYNHLLQQPGNILQQSFSGCSTLLFVLEANAKHS